MTCRDLNEYLDQGRGAGLAELPVEARRHLDECASCRRLWRFLETDTETAIDESLSARIESGLMGTLEPVRPLPSARVITLAFLGIFLGLSAAVVLWNGSSRGLDSMSALQITATLGLLGVAALALSGELSRGMVPGEKRMVSSRALYTGVLGSLILAVLLLFPWGPEENIFRHSGMCLRTGLTASIPAALLFGFVLKRGSALSFPAVGAGAGLLSGLVGVVALHFGCPMHFSPHMLVGHLGIPVFAAALGFGIGLAIEHFAPAPRWNAN